MTASTTKPKKPLKPRKNKRIPEENPPGFFLNPGITSEILAILSFGGAYQMSKQNFSGNISGKGYYIALVLCALAIGISGYLYYRNTNKPAAQYEEPSASVMEQQAQDVPAAATQPHNPVQQPTQPANTEPAPVEKPGKRVAPVSGQTLLGYSVDCLSYNQTTRDWRTHDGMDIAAEAGSPVLAAADGEVYSVYEDEIMGTTVVLIHTGGYTTSYASLAQEVAVAPGDQVTAGQTIGTVGRTALLESAVGDHVHFSVSCSGQRLDPEAFLAGA